MSRVQTPAANGIDHIPIVFIRLFIGRTRGDDAHSSATTCQMFCPYVFLIGVFWAETTGNYDNGVSGRILSRRCRLRRHTVGRLPMSTVGVKVSTSHAVDLLPNSAVRPKIISGIGEQDVGWTCYTRYNWRLSLGLRYSNLTFGQRFLSQWPINEDDAQQKLSIQLGKFVNRS